MPIARYQVLQREDHFVVRHDEDVTGPYVSRKPPSRQRSQRRVGRCRKVSPSSSPCRAAREGRFVGDD